jgi:two-component system response regulator NreC
MNTPRSIGIIEDEELLLELLADVCKVQFGYNVVFTALNMTIGLARIRETKPDALLLDLNLLDGDGLDFVQHLRAQKILVKIIIVSADTTPETQKRVRQSGVEGFVSKYSYSTCLRQALENVLEHGRTYFSPVAPDKSAMPYSKILTARQLELLPFVGVGLSDAEIASMVGLSVSMVHKHRNQMMEKLGVKNQPDLLSFCFKVGLLKSRPDGGLIVPKWSNSIKKQE